VNHVLSLQDCGGGSSTGITAVPGLRQAKATNRGTRSIRSQPEEGGRERGMIGGREGGREWRGL